MSPSRSRAALLRTGSTLWTCPRVRPSRSKTRSWGEATKRRSPTGSGTWRACPRSLSARSADTTTSTASSWRAELICARSAGPTSTIPPGRSMPRPIRISRSDGRRNSSAAAGSRQPMGPADLPPIFPQAIIAQELSAEPWIEIPDEVREIYRIWRPTPLYRADRLEKALDTPAHIYFKYEGVSPAGSHKPYTAVPQAYYNAKEGVKRLTTETGAGQWGSALS